MRLLIVILLIGALAACSPSAIVDKLLTPQERSLARAAMEDVGRNDRISLSKKMPTELRPQLESAMPAMHRAMPPGPYEITSMSANVATTNGVRTVHAIFRVRGKPGWAIAEATITTERDQPVLQGMYVQRTAVDPIEISKFRLSDAGIAGWSMLAAMSAAIGITIAGLIRIWRADGFQLRWLWTLGALFGVTTLRLAWTTGEWSFQPISIQLFSASAVKSPVYAPWVLAVSVPVVALIALVRRPRTVDENASEGADASSTD